MASRMISSDGVKLVHRFAPAGGGKLDRQAAGGNEVEGFADEICNGRIRPVAVDLDEVEMRKAIDQAARGDLADAAKIIGVDVVDIAAGELFGAGRDAVEHLIGVDRGNGRSRGRNRGGPNVSRSSARPALEVHGSLSSSIPARIFTSGLAARSLSISSKSMPSW